MSEQIDISKIKINVDAGHGSDTPGKRTAPFVDNIDIDGDGTIDVHKGQQYREHYANVMIAKMLYDKLKVRGFGVMKTGWNDANSVDDLDTSIIEREKLVEAGDCDISISCHFNACGNGQSFNSGEGIGIYVHSIKANQMDSVNLANVLLGQLVKGTKQKNRGVGTGEFGMCNARYMGVTGAVIVEFSFMTNEHEAEDLMANKEYCEECANELYAGVCEYFKVDKNESLTKEKIKASSQSSKSVQTKTPDKASSFNEYSIRVTTENLNIREHPTIEAKVVGLIKNKGVYTIVEVSTTGKWGKLKSGAGWINLGYTEKVR